MSALKSFSRGRGRRFWTIGATLVVASVVAVVFVAASGAVLPGSPSQFESNDGNMTLDTSGNTDWNCFAGAGNTGGFSTSVSKPAGCKVTTGAKQTTADPAGEIIWKPGQKFDTQCPTVQTGNVPNKDDFTNVASYTEMDSSNNAYFYGASIRAASNGDSSGDVEFDQQSGTGDTFACRTAGDLLLGYDFTNGGATLNLKVLTWIDSTNSTAGGNNGTCFVSSDSMPCWGANVLQPASSSAEGLANQAAIAALDNGIGGTALAVNQFAEFGVDLTTALGLTTSCLSFPQLVWESRSSGSSFGSNPEDIEFQKETINTCAQPTITTVASPTSALAIGQSATIGDTATLANGNSPSGKVTFTLYSDAACTNPVGVSGTATISNNQASFSTSWTPTTAGTYYWIASYPGDNKNLGFTTGCGDANEQLTVAQNSPGIVTAASSGTIGDAIHDTATLSGATATAGGTITFNLYGPSASPNCSGTAVYTKVVSVSGNGGYGSGDFTPTTAGSYYWVASYSGDVNNQAASGSCGDSGETSTIGQKSPGIVTAATSAAVGSPIHDTATLSGATATAGGTITFNLYGPSDSPDCSGDPVYTNTVDVSGNGGYGSGDFTPTTAGSYYWVASYSGDVNNQATNGSCGDSGETSTLGKQPTSIGTAATSGTIGDAIHDTATLSGATEGAGGTITFSLYGPSATPDCSGDPIYTNTVDVSGNGDYGSGDFTPTTAGSYYWVASYSGDTNNQATSGSCGDEGETSTLGKQPTSIATAATSASNGDAIHDTATLSGATEGAGGTITFSLYGPSATPDCSGDPIYTNTVDVDGPGAYNSGDFTPSGPGSYYWVASYSGDGNNQATTGSCGDEGETSTIKAAHIDIVKTADAASVTVGHQIGFTMTVSNSGAGDAKGVTLSDTLPTNPGLSWSIASQGAGWGGSCAIAAGKLTCGPVTVPAGTTQAASTFTVHITSTTAAAAGGDCPGSGTVNNTGSVTTTNDGSGQSSASTCVQALVDLSVTKAGSPANQQLGTGNITWTIVVTNNGPDADTGVTVTDPMPGGNTFVSATATQGTCTGGAILTCNIGNMAAGASVTITLVTTPSVEGTQTNTVTVSGNRPETNTTNNTATATVNVFKGTPPVFCVAVSKVTPQQLFVGRKTALTIHLTQDKKAVSGIHVRIKGPKLNIKTKASNSKGVVKQSVKVTKAGVLVFTPIASKACNTKRVGITNVFTPPVTG